MKNRIIFCSVFLIIASGLFSSNVFAGNSGIDIMREREERQTHQSEYVRLEMSIFDSKDREKKQVMHLWFYKDEKKQARTLMKFSSPSKVSGTGLLTWEQKESEEDDQWLYLSAAKRVKRIAGSSKKNLFMGTDLAYEDLRPESLNAHTYKIVKEEMLDGKDCWIIEALPSTPSEKKYSGYSKRLLWIQKDNYLNVKTEFFGRGGKLIKIGSYRDPENIKGDLWVSNTTEMNRLSSKTKTIIIKTNRQIDQEIDQTLITQQGLKRPTNLK
ncbi:outer membrane lipoprotein-sorting protein [bacterium]|nr:outer membrane lipoprotein-sorting protein [bacterium]